MFFAAFSVNYTAEFLRNAEPVGPNLHKKIATGASEKLSNYFYSHIIFTAQKLIFYVIITVFYTNLFSNLSFDSSFDFLWVLIILEHYFSLFHLIHVSGGMLHLYDMLMWMKKMYNYGTNLELAANFCTEIWD